MESTLENWLYYYKYWTWCVLKGLIAQADACQFNFLHLRLSAGMVEWSQDRGLAACSDVPVLDGGKHHMVNNFC